MENSLKEIVLEKRIIILPTKEEQDKRLIELSDKHFNKFELAREYGNWYAVQILKYCSNESDIWIPKDSILNIIKRLEN